MISPEPRAVHDADTPLRGGMRSSEGGNTLPPVMCPTAQLPLTVLQEAQIPYSVHHSLVGAAVALMGVMHANMGEFSRRSLSDGSIFMIWVPGATAASECGGTEGCRLIQHNGHGLRSLRR